MRRTVEICCAQCNALAYKPESEVKRNLELGRRLFCCRSCVAIAGNTPERPLSLRVSKTTVRHKVDCIHGSMIAMVAYNVFVHNVLVACHERFPHAGHFVITEEPPNCLACLAA